MELLTSSYAPFIGIAAFAAGAFLSVEWQGRIRPLLIRRTEIESLADELIDNHGDRAEEMAFIEEDRAWRYSQNFEQGKWRRVRKELERRSRL
ncbi:hypothetical protein NAC44_03695 [Allorhizobium sp. BGMRC 0089]|uniref:hypothetical protein n=1 Tax=Allorhizobium sonneratiae TaxID=2934936 RepID=UPI002033A11F|nr:hypothetical protein [Allorhizobium sonneratiae]MCM2291431.1 hypothetical protein [Allorhizobium sonneratiae]